VCLGDRVVFDVKFSHENAKRVSLKLSQYSGSFELPQEEIYFSGLNDGETELRRSLENYYGYFVGLGPLPLNLRNYFWQWVIL
jgi:hypothetical protein